MVRNAGFKNIKVLRNIDSLNVELCDLNVLSQKDSKLSKFYTWNFEMGYSNIIFADKVILYEGDTERLYLRKLLLPSVSPEYEKLSTQYISYIQVGGKYASNYKCLIEFLKIPTLIITDIDYSHDLKKISDIENSQYGNKRGVNGTITNLLELKNKEKVKDVYKKKKEVGDYIYLTFQTENDSYARTLEEAMLGKYFDINVSTQVTRSDWIKMQKSSKIDFIIPQNLPKLDNNGNKNKRGKTVVKEDDSLFTLRDILDSTSNSKTNFMYSIIDNNLVKKIEPNYIKEGLLWLMKQ